MELEIIFSISFRVKVMMNDLYKYSSIKKLKFKDKYNSGKNIWTYVTKFSILNTQKRKKFHREIKKLEETHVDGQ